MALTLVSEPSEFSWSRHPLKFVASSDAVGNVRIRQELRLASDDSLIAQTANLTLDDNDRVSYDWSKQVTDQVAGEVPTLEKLGYSHTKGSLDFYVRFVEVVNGVDGATQDSSDRIAVFGSNEYYTTSYQYQAIDTAKAFLFQTSKPLSREHHIGQEEVATVLFTADQVAPTLRVTITYTDDSTEQLPEVLPEVSKGDLITFDLSDRAWDYNSHQPAKTIKKILVDFNGLTGDTLTLNVVQVNSRQAYNYLYSNNRGGFDMLYATGQKTDIDKIEGEVYQDDQNLLRVRQDIRQDIFEQLSGFIPRAEITAYKQMRDINRAWFLVGSTLTGIVIFPQETKVQADGENLNQFLFRWTAGHGRQDFDIINAIQA